MDKEKLLQLLKLAHEQGITSTKVAGPDHLDYSARHYEAWKTTTESNVRERLMKLLHESADLDDFNGKMFVLGTLATRVDYENLAAWLLYRTLKVGEQQTVEELEKFINLEATPAFEILAFSGVEVRENVMLHKKIRLAPFDSIPECFAKEVIDYSHLQSHLKHPFGPLGELKSFCPSGALIRETGIKPKSCEPDDCMKFTFSSEELYQVCECLTLIGQSTPVPLTNWVLVEEWVPCSIFLQGGWTAPAHDVLNVSSHKLTESECVSAKNLVQQYFGLRQSTRELLRVSLQRLNLSRRRSRPVDKSIDLGIALESLLLHDRASNEPISFPFRLRGAWIMGSDASKREEYMQLFKSIYDCRCEAVHTGKFTTKFTKKLHLPLNDLLKKGEDLCAEMIKWILQKGELPEWKKLIVGGG